MSKNNSQYRMAQNNKVIRKRLYKSKGHWNIATAGMLTAGAATVIGMVGANNAVHADTVSPTGASVAEGSSISTNENVSTGSVSQTQTAPVAAPVVQNSSINTANAGLNQAVTTQQPVINQAGGTINPVTPTNIPVQSVNNEISNVNATGSADAQMYSAYTNASAVTSRVGGQIVPTSAQDVTSWTPESITSFGSVQAGRISATGSANVIISGAVASNSAMISNAGGVMAPGKMLDVSKMTPGEIASAVASAQKMVEATGSADSQLMSASNQYTSTINAAGGQLKRSDAINTADNMTVSDVEASVQSQVNKISVTASADSDLVSAVGSAVPKVNANSGIMSAGSTIDASKLGPTIIQSMVSAQNAMISATAQADADVKSAIDAVASAISAVNGTLSSQSINTADNMTVESVLSMAASNVANLQATGKVDSQLGSLLNQYSGAIASAGGQIKQGKSVDVSSMSVEQITSLGNQLEEMLSLAGQHDTQVMSQVANATSDVSKVSGVINPGSAIDITNWTVSQVQSEMAQQSAMISVTASGDAYLTGIVNSAAPVINGVGGTIKQNGLINTANNMTVSDVESSVKSQADKINNVVAAESAIGSVTKANSGAIQLVSGAEKPGSTIDVSSMTISEVLSIASHQVAMVNATGSADTEISKYANSASPDITKVGGTIKQDGLINTADNMTVDSISQSVKKQEELINGVVVGDKAIASVIAANSGAISNVSGVETPGSAIDVTSMTLSEVESITSHQVAMVNATGSADNEISNHAHSAEPTITKIGGSIKQDGLINTADNMTVDQISQSVKKQEQLIDQTVSGDSAIASVVDANSGAISNVSGVETPGSVIDVTSMNTSEVESITSHQVAMVNATGSADNEISNHAHSAEPTITKIGGSIKQDGLINTADNMTVDQISQSVKKQEQLIDQTVSGDSAIASVVDANSGAISNVSGVETPGSVIDVTSMNTSEVESITSHQVAMVNATGSADNEISNHAHSAEPTITKIGGSIKQDGLINTADNMTVDQISQSVKKQEQLIDQTVSGDSAIASVVDANSGAISNVSGVETPGSVIDVTSMNTSEVESITSHQVAMVNATGSADVMIKSNADSNAKLAQQAGGYIKQSGNINTADNMTVDQIAKSAASQSATLNAVGFGDETIAKASSVANDLSKQFGGGIIAGSALDVTKMTISQIDSLVMSQTAVISAVGVNNQKLSQTQVLVSDVVNAVGGIVKAGSVVDVTNMTLSDIQKMFASEQETLSAVGDGDRQIGSAVTDNMNAIQLAGGKILSAGAINMANKSANEIEANAKSQAANIVATGKFDTVVPSAASQYAPGINTFGGSLSKSVAIDVSSMNESQINSLMNSKVANFSTVASANPALSTAEASAKNAVSAFGGVMQKGSNIDASSMSAGSIASSVQSQIEVISATGSADSVGKSAVDSARAGIEHAGGTITRGSDVDATKMNGSAIVNLGNSQVDNITHVGSADSQIVNAMSQYSPMINNAAHGAIHIGSAVNASSMTNDKMASIANSNVTQLSLTGSGDSLLGSTINVTKGVIETNDGTLTSAKAIDATNLSSDQIDRLIRAQEQNIEATAGGDQTLKQASGDVSAETTTKGSVVDVTGMTSQAIGSLVASQVTKIGETQNANDQIHQAVSNTTKHITEIGGKVYVQPVVNTTKMSSQEIASVVASQTGRLDQAATGDDMTSSAIAANIGEITKHGGWIHQGNELVVDSLSSQQVVDNVKSQVNHLNATGSAAKVINQAVDRNNAAVTAVSASMAASDPYDVTKLTDGEIISYGNSVANHINHMGSGDTLISQAIAQHASGVALSGTLDVTNMTDAQIDSVAQSIATEVSMADSYNKYIDSLAGSLRGDGWAVAVGSTTADGVSASNAASEAMSRVNSETTSLAKSVADYQSAFEAKVKAMPTQLITEANGFTPLYPNANAWQNVNLNGGQMAWAEGSANYLDHRDNPNGQLTIHILGKGINAGDIIKQINVDGCPVVLESGSWGNWNTIKDSYQPTDVGSFKPTSVTDGSVLRFKGAVTYNDGSTDDLLVKFSARGTTNRSIMVWSDAQGAVNSYVAPTTASSHNTLPNNMVFSVGSGKRVVWPVIVSDVDLGQTVYTTLSKNSGSIIGVGGGLQRSDGDYPGVKARMDLGNVNPKVGRNSTLNDALTGIDSQPDGTFAFYEFSNAVDMTVQNDPRSNAFGVAAALFGRAGTANVITPPKVRFNKINLTVPSLTTSYKTVATNYTPYSANVTDHLNYTYNPMKTTYKALDVTTTPLSTQYHVFNDNGGYSALDDSWSPASTSFHALSDDGGYHPETYATTPLAATYQGYETDGKSIEKINPSIISDGHGGYKINPTFTGYAPLSVRYKGYQTDGKSIEKTNPSIISDGHGGYKINPTFTGYAPLSVRYKGYQTDGKSIEKTNPSIISDGHGGYKINPTFTGYAPLSVRYKGYQTDGKAIEKKTPSIIPDGHGGYKVNPKFTGYAPLSVQYKGYETDGSKIPPVIPDGHGGYKVNPKFTGYAPLSVTYQGYETDGSKIPSVIPDPNHPGHYIKNPKFTGYTPFSYTNTPLSTKYDVFSSDGSKIPPMIPDGHGGYKPNPKFTGFAPFSTDYHPYSSDGSKVPNGDKFTGYQPYGMNYTPLSTTYTYGTGDNQTPAKPQEQVPTPVQPKVNATSSPVVSVAPVQQGQAPAQMQGPSASPVVVPAPVQSPLPALAPSEALPQTGYKHSMVALAGLAGIGLTMGLGLAMRKKQKEE